MKSRRTALAVLIASFLWAGTLCASAETGKKHPATDANGLHYALGAMLSFGDKADIYLVSRKPLTLYYVQWFRDKLHDDVLKGSLLLTFEKGSLHFKGLGLSKAHWASYEKRDKELDKAFLRMATIDGKSAPDLYPSYHQPGIIGQATFWQGLGVSVDGHQEPRGIIIKTQDGKSTIELYPDMDIEKPVGVVLAKVSYESPIPTAPWVYTEDLNSDSSSEILIGQAMYKRKILVILTTTPKSFKALRDNYELTMGFSDEWPQSGTEVFKKGFTKRIPLK